MKLFLLKLISIQILLFNLTKSDNQLQIFYDSYCLQCPQVLGSNLNKLLKIMGNFNELDIELKPFLNGSFYQFQDKNLFTCPEGPNECDMDQIQSCVLQETPNTYESTKFISCMNYLLNKDPNQENIFYYNNCKKILKVNVEQTKSVENCVLDSTQKQKALLKYAQESIDVLQDTNPAIKYLGNFLNLEETQKFFKDPLQYICQNNYYNFCKQNQTPDQEQNVQQTANQEEGQQTVSNDLKNDIDQLQNQNIDNQKIVTSLLEVDKMIQNYQNNTDQKFQFFQNQIKQISEQIQGQMTDSETLKEGLQKLRNQLEQGLNLAPKQQEKIVGLARVQKKEQDKLIQEIDAQNNYIYEAIMDRLELLKNDFIDQIDNINENIDRAQFQQNAYIQQRLNDISIEKEKKVIKQNKIKENSLDQSQKLPNIVKITIKKVQQKEEQKELHENQEKQNQQKNYDQDYSQVDTQDQKLQKNDLVQQQNQQLEQIGQKQLEKSEDQKQNDLNILQSQSQKLLVDEKQNFQSQEDKNNLDQNVQQQIKDNLNNELQEQEEDLNKKDQTQVKDYDNKNVQTLKKMDEIQETSQQQSLLFKEENPDTEKKDAAEFNQQHQKMIEEAYAEFNQQKYQNSISIYEIFDIFASQTKKLLKFFIIS